MMKRILEVFSSGDLIKSLTSFNLNAKYKGSVLGLLWSMLKPVAMMIIFSLVFTKIVRFQVNGPYPVFLLCGLLPWNFMSMSLSSGASAMLDHANLIKKVFLPAETFIFSICLANLVDLMLAFLVYLAFMIFFKVSLTFCFLLFPLVVFLHFMFVFGASMLLATSTVFFRDTRQMLEVVLLAWFYVSPVIYPVSDVPSEFLGIYMCNPMAVYMTLYRDVLFAGEWPSASHLLMGALWGIGALISGYVVFLRHEERFPELV